MDDRIRDAFNQIHAPEELKERTRDYIAQEREKHAKRRFCAGRFRFLAPALACFFFVLLAGNVRWLYFTPTASISIDINPSLELGINRFDRVVSVEGYNDDGKELADSLDVMYQTYTQAVEEILADGRIASLLSEDGALTIAVAGTSERQCGRILTQMEVCASGHENAHCYSMDSGEAALAHEMGLSCGKYRAYQELLALDPDVEPEEVRNMSMKEIRQRIAELSGENFRGQGCHGKGGHHGEKGTGS